MSELGSEELGAECVELVKGVKSKRRECKEEMGLKMRKM